MSNFFAELSGAMFTKSQLAGRRSVAMSADEQRKLAAIMFTDLLGYSALSQRNDNLIRKKREF